ncbi:uncharacterized protein LOC143566077 [Bidens hawaiensis]|uniref:uncharacterized protein LOC143566077 n=1 Tax=Bidens hawaiensis TaxID=980011 RepID=UPI00404A1130
MASYCQEVKILADQLANVDVPLYPTQLVLQVLGGLAEQYRTVATVICSTDPLPEFNVCRSRLCQEETDLAAHALHAAQSAGAALLAASKTETSHEASHNNKTESTADWGRGRSRGRGRGRGRTMFGRGRGGTPHHPQTPWGPLLAYQPEATPHSWQHWQTMPPCPYPTVARPPTQTSQAILGPRPAQAYQMGYVPTGYIPTNID